MCAIKSVCVCVYLITWATSSIWLKFYTKTARLSWKSPSRVMVKWSPAMVFVCSTLVCVCVSLHACSSSAAPWPTGALLSDWRLAGELYDGAVSPAVSHSPGSGSPDTLRNTSECNFSHILSELSFEWKNPPACLALFVFTNVWAKKMVILHAGIKYVHMHWWTVWERDFRKDECTLSVVLGTLVKELDLLWEKAGFVESL